MNIMFHSLKLAFTDSLKLGVQVVILVQFIIDIRSRFTIIRLLISKSGLLHFLFLSRSIVNIPKSTLPTPRITPCNRRALDLTGDRSVQIQRSADEHV